MGKDGKKKSKDRSHDEEEPASAAATRSVSVKTLKETLLPVPLHVIAC